MAIPVVLISADASAIEVTVPFDAAPEITDYNFLVNPLADVQSGYVKVFTVTNVESPPGFVTATIPLEDLQIPDLNRTFFMRATKIRTSIESLLSASDALKVDLADDIIPLAFVDSSPDNQVMAINYAIDPISGNFVPVNASSAAGGGFALATQVPGVPLSFQTGSTVAIGTSSSVALAINTSRKYAILANFGSEIIYLGIGFTPVVGVGIPIFPGGGAYEIVKDTLTTQVVNAISSQASQDLFVQEAT